MGKPRTAEWWPRSDRGQAGRSNFSVKLSLQLGARWLFCRLLTGGLTLSAAKLRTTENISLPTLAPTLERFFRGVVSGVGVFFFFLELPSSHLQMNSRMCSAQKCAFWQRGAEPTTCKGHERFLRTSAVSALDVPTTYHKCVSWVTYCANATTKPVLARTSTSVPRARSSFSAFAFTVTHIVKGATTTLPIPSPSHPCSRQRDSRSKLRKARRTKHENKESISI